MAEAELNSCYGENDGGEMPFVPNCRAATIITNKSQGTLREKEEHFAEESPALRTNRNETANSSHETSGEARRKRRKFQRMRREFAGKPRETEAGIQIKIAHTN